MIILDTSVWIEHLKNNQSFFPKISKLLESGEILAVECVFAELLQGVKENSEKDIIILIHSIKSRAQIWTLDNKFLKIIPEELRYSEIKV